MFGSDSLTILTTACQPAPLTTGDFKAGLSDGGQIALSWPDFSDEVQGVLLRRSEIGSGRSVEMGRFTGAGNSFLDGATQCGTTYRYLLTALNGAGVTEELCLLVTLPVQCEGLTVLDYKPCDDLPKDAQPYCGDGICNGLDSPIKCPEDCGVMIASPTPLSTCGDGVCTGLESPIKCPEDCGVMITPTPVPTLVPTGVGPTLVGPTFVPTLVGPTLVPTTVPVCGNGTCEPGESFATCQGDCPTVCGDGVCEGLESSIRCPEDCGGPMITPTFTPVPVCGDGVCNGGETILSCALDCPLFFITLVPPVIIYCGDHICNGSETCSSCAIDCGPC